MILKTNIDATFRWMSRTETQTVSEEITRAQVEISTFCNMSCMACVRNSIRDFAPRHLSPGLAKKITASLAGLPSLERVVLLGFGEPLCNPSFKKIMTGFASLGRHMTLVSNGALLDVLTADFLFSLPLSELYLSWDDDITGTDPLRNRQGLAAQVFRERLSGICGARKRAGGRTALGIEIVATSANLDRLHETIAFGRGLGVERFIVSNMYPYSEQSARIILYGKDRKLRKKAEKIFDSLRRHPGVTAAGVRMDAPRACPFIERGTVFISSSGDVSPCPELAYTHDAFNPHRRTHNSLRFGNTARAGIGSIWRCDEFAAFRRNFEYYEFPDCSDCTSPEACWHRNMDEEDCYGNRTPCGECLWAKGIIVCP